MNVSVFKLRSGGVSSSEGQKNILTSAARVLAESDNPRIARDAREAAIALSVHEEDKDKTPIFDPNHLACK